MRQSPKHFNRFMQLGKAIRYNMREGKAFKLVTTSKEYWRRMIELDIEDCTIEEWDDGLVIKGK